MADIDERAGGTQRRTGATRVVAVAAALAVGAGLATSCSADHETARPGPPITSIGHPGNPPGSHPGRPHPGAQLLSTYRNCAALLAGLRKHTAAHVTVWGLPGTGGGYVGGPIVPQAKSAAGVPAAADSTAAPAHSTTNTQEPGIGEPDTVLTDGRRVVSISGGVLRVVDAATHAITGTLDLSMYAGADSAQLLMRGDRVLVLTGGSGTYVTDGPVEALRYPGPYLAGQTTAILVDLRRAPAIVATFHTSGLLVAARMVDGTVRVVVRSAPRFAFPKLPDSTNSGHRRTANRTTVADAPLGAWLPQYTVSSASTSETETVPCGDVRHPADYAGTSMLTVYTVRLGGGLRNLEPVSITADGTTAYATAHDLYVGSSRGTDTLLHRFDIDGSGRPIYLGSGKVPGVVQDSYSMSQYGASLRVVTTTGAYAGKPVSALYVLDARTLRLTGRIGGLGRGEQLHAVRFLGPLAYVVTFQSVDPLYVLDLRDPKHPKKAGELTITGYSDYLHQTADGRLLGVGEDVHTTSDGNQVVNGLQVSLFDVTRPAHPRRLDRVIRTHTPSETPIDPHAFLYWPRTGTAVIPIDSWTEAESGAALVLHVDRTGLRTVGTIRNPLGSAAADDGIERTLVIGSQIWTMSAGGLAVSDLSSLHREAWVQFS